MKIALTAMGNTMDSQLDPRFGRAKMFILYDTETDEFSVIDNKLNLNAAQGAGIQSAGNIAASGAKVLISGHCGPKAFGVLSSAGIKVYSAKTDMVTVSEAIELFKNGELKEADSADVEGHW